MPTLMAGPEIAAFRDVPTDKLVMLATLASGALTELIDVDRMLQEAEEPLPVLSVSVNYERDRALPSIWMGLGMTEPGNGLQYAEDTKYIPRPNAPSDRVKIPGLALPVTHDSISSVKFFPYDRDEDEVVGFRSESGWWEHWQRHRFTRKAGDHTYVHDYDDEISFPLFATWFRGDPSRSEPIILASDPDASEIVLIPAEGSLRTRHQAAIFLGGHAAQSLLGDSTRIAVAREFATEPFHAMMSAAASELGLEYRS